MLEVEEASSHEDTETNRHLSTTLLQLSSTVSRLFIDCVSHSDAGLYVCVAETPTKRIALDYILKVGQSLYSVCLPIFLPVCLYMSLSGCVSCVILVN